jgi:hypothetical protein
LTKIKNRPAPLWQKGAFANQLAGLLFYFEGGVDDTNRAMKSAGTVMLSVLTNLRRSFLGLAILTTVGVVLWSAGWVVIGIVLAAVGGFGLFLGLVTVAKTGDDVTEAVERLDYDPPQLSKDEARLVTLLRDRNIDPSTIIARIPNASIRSVSEQAFI